jgi:hypothetical protein
VCCGVFGWFAVPLDDVSMPGGSDGALDLQNSRSVYLLMSQFYSKIKSFVALFGVVIAIRKVVLIP